MANGNEGEAATAADVEKQLEQIRKDIAGLAETIASLAASKAGEVKEQAVKAGNEAAAASVSAVHSACEQVNHVRGDLEDAIREKPLHSLGIAAGIGFFLALLMRRA